MYFLQLVILQYFLVVLQDVLADNSDVLLRYDLQPDQQLVILQYFLVVKQDVLADKSDILLRYDLLDSQISVYFLQPVV